MSRKALLAVSRSSTGDVQEILSSRNKVTIPTLVSGAEKRDTWVANIINGQSEQENVVTELSGCSARTSPYFGASVFCYDAYEG